MKKTVDEYMAMPYTTELIPDEGCWFVKIKELKGCMSEGETVEEALEMIRDAMKAWLEVAITEGDEIPLPESMQQADYSGRISLRMPKSLHRKIAEEAKAEGVSINSYIVTTLSEQNAFHRAEREMRSILADNNKSRSAVLASPFVRAK